MVPEVRDWLTQRYEVDRSRFSTLLGEGPFFHGAAPGIGDCAIWGYSQWLAEAGVEASPDMAAWLERMRGLDAMRTPAEFFPGPPS
jgi:glutathione S-transferase